MSEDSDEPLAPVFIPPLLMQLARAEQEKGSPLTREEVFSARDHGVRMLMTAKEAAAMAESRGYDDIDPEHAWEQWQVARQSLPKAVPSGGPRHGRFRFVGEDKPLGSFPTDPKQRHEAFIELFGRQVFALRNERLERIRALVEGPREERERIGSLHAQEYTAVADQPPAAREAALNLSRKAMDLFLQDLLGLFTYNGLSIDLRLGTDHAIAYELLLKVIGNLDRQPVEAHVVNKGGQKVFGEYYGRWINRHKDA